MTDTIKTWLDMPKPGETNAGWCYSKSTDGHITEVKCSFETEEAALDAATYDPLEDFNYVGSRHHY